jgi:hypothetical protein
MAEKNRGGIAVDFPRFPAEPFVREWEHVSIRERFDDALGSYSVTFKPVREKLRHYQQRLQKGELVRFYVDGRVYATPMVETVTTTIDRDGGVKLNADCKSVLAAATEASANPTIYRKQKADVPIIDLVLEVLAPFGFSEIAADAAANAMALTGKPRSSKAAAITAEPLKAKDAQVQDNETAYGYCARLFSRLGVALRVNRKGRLMLAAPDYEQRSIYTITEWLGGGDRAESLSLVESNAGQFSKIVVLGKGNEKRGKKQTAQPRGALRQERLTGRFDEQTSQEASAQAAWDALSANEPYADVPTETFVADQPLYTSALQPFKPLYFVDKRSRDNDRCASFCKLVHTKNAPKAFELTAVVDGLVAATGATWAVDTICTVKSPELGLIRAGQSMDLWVNEVQLDASRNGSKSTVKMIPKGSLVIGNIPG